MREERLREIESQLEHDDLPRVTQVELVREVRRLSDQQRWLDAMRQAQRQEGPPIDVPEHWVKELAARLADEMLASTRNALDAALSKRSGSSEG